MIRVYSEYILFATVIVPLVVIGFFIVMELQLRYSRVLMILAVTALRSCVLLRSHDVVVMNDIWLILFPLFVIAGSVATASTLEVAVRHRVVSKKTRNVLCVVAIVLSATLLLLLRGSYWRQDHEVLFLCLAVELGLSVTCGLLLLSCTVPIILSSKRMRFPRNDKSNTLLLGLFFMAMSAQSYLIIASPPVQGANLCLVGIGTLICHLGWITFMSRERLLNGRQAVK